MDYSYSKEQKILADSARDFLKNEAPGSEVKLLFEDDKGYSPKIWKKMSELGWQALVIDEKYNGIGSSFIDLAIIMVEIGRSAMPGPFFSTVVLSGLLMQDSGSEEIKSKYLPEIADGKCISTLAFLGKNGFYSKNDIEIESKKANNEYILNGSAFFVPYAHAADIIICAAKNSSNNDDVTLFVVDVKKTSGLEITQLKTISGIGIECMITLKDVKVSSDNIIGETGKGWGYIKALWPKISVALSCMCTGGMQKVVEMTCDYVNQRIQFGRPLAAFQAVAHLCSDMCIKSEVSKRAVFPAAWHISENNKESKNEAAIVKAMCSEAFKDITKIAHQVTGAIGFTEEYDLHLYTKYAKTLEVLFGNGSFHRNIVADELGL